jgi:hypothetical protein
MLLRCTKAFDLSPIITSATGDEVCDNLNDFSFTELRLIGSEYNTIDESIALFTWKTKAPADATGSNDDRDNKTMKAYEIYIGTSSEGQPSTAADSKQRKIRPIYRQKMEGIAHTDARVVHASIDAGQQLLAFTLARRRSCDDGQPNNSNLIELFETYLAEISPQNRVFSMGQPVAEKQRVQASFNVCMLIYNYLVYS